MNDLESRARVEFLTSPELERVGMLVDGRMLLSMTFEMACQFCFIANQSLVNLGRIIEENKAELVADVEYMLKEEVRNGNKENSAKDS